MNKFISRSLLKVLGIFFFWRIFLILASIFAINYVSLRSSDRYLGGGPINYLIGPELFSWANFDGEHYLSIAIFGYKVLEQAFFPIYPLLISFFSKPFSADLLSHTIASTMIGLFISNASFILALFFLWKLLRIDFSEKIVLLTFILIILFPTSFYFGALYNESLFLLLSVLAFYNASKKRWLISSIFGTIASATRVFGVLLLIPLLVEAYKSREKLSKTFWLFLTPLGFLIYMFYQYQISGDPLAFYNLQTVVGEQHQRGIIFLPQVYFRYIKMLLSVDIQNPIYQTILLEFVVGVVFFLLPIYGYFKKIRISYLLYAMLGFLLPTIQGSFSSVPRYVIILFPSFLAAAIWLNYRSKIFQVILFCLLLLLLFAETTLFLRGYWVA